MPKTAINPLIPTECPSCNGDLKVVGIHLMCLNKNCPEQNILRILHWVTNCGIENFAESSVRTLYNVGVVKSVKDLYKLTSKSFNGVEGFGTSKISNALSEIERTREMTLSSFIDKLSIDLVGERAVAKIGINTIDEFLNLKAGDDDFVVAQNIVAFVKENRNYINELLSVVKIVESVKTVAKEDARHIAMTGIGPDKREALIEKIAGKGDVFDDGVRKTTNILLCEDKSAGTTKLQKAEKMGVTIMNYSEYFN